MSRFVPNPGFRRELQADPRFAKGIAFITTGVAEQIEAAAEPFRASGYFVRHVRARRNRVLLRDPFAHLVELGSANNPPQANARRGVRAAGLRFADDGRKQAD